MKKILIVVLALVLVLAMGAGCGKDEPVDGGSAATAGSSDTGSGAGSGADAGASAGIVDAVVWPADGFPAGFPEYTGGTLISAESYDGGATARISGTNDDDVAAYISALEAAGWSDYAAEGNAEGTTLMQEKDENTYLIAFLGFVNDGSGDFVVSVNERAASQE